MIGVIGTVREQSNSPAGERGRGHDSVGEIVPTPPELRIALAMRGGVSLAVWMGGACSEIDALRRARPDEGDSSLYARLLAATGYGSVAVDAVAGASAGGLNSVLMGCSIVYGTPFDSHIRDIWLRLGDIGTLSRPWSWRPPQSVLDGDGRFYAPLLDELKRLTPSETEAHDLKPRLDLNLTGTLFSSVRNVRYPDLGDQIVESRNRARFRFRHLPMPAGHESVSDFDASPRDVVLERLAYAARATSSFPGAFEPASVGYAPDSARPADGPPVPATHHGVFSESRPAGSGDGRDLVIDGGVLDNIPVAWAVRSIAAAPADRPVVRWLVYLQPVPFSPPVPSDAARPGLRQTVKRAQQLQRGTEKLGDDIDELERLQSDALVRGGFRQVLEYALGQLPEGEQLGEFLNKLFERALASSALYRERVGAIEANRLRRLWTDPMPVLGADPLGFSELGPIAAGTADVSRLLQSLRGLDAGELVLDAPTGSGATTAEPPRTGREALRLMRQRIRTPQVLARTVMLLLDTARELEDRGYEIKGELYGLRSAIELTVARHDRWLAAAPCTAAPTVPALELARRAAWRLGHAAPQAQAESAEPEWAAEDAGWPHDPFSSEWDQLVDFALRLARVARTHSDDPASAPARPSPRAFLSCLIGAAADTTDPAGSVAAVLMAVELLTGPLRPDPFPESSQVRFHMMSALNPSPLPALGKPGGGQLGVQDKLAGDQLANFGAFFSARWRLNDWIWGRLDAATSLVNILTAPQSGSQPVPDLNTLREIAHAATDADLETVRDALIARLHAQILREELPLFDKLRTGPLQGALPQPQPPDPPAPGPADAADLDPSALLRTGQETVKGLVLRTPALWLVTAKVGVGAARAWAQDCASSVLRAARREWRGRPSDA